MQSGLDMNIHDVFNQTENGSTEGGSAPPGVEGRKARRVGKEGWGGSDGRLWELEADGANGVVVVVVGDTRRRGVARIHQRYPATTTTRKKTSLDC